MLLYARTVVDLLDITAIQTVTITQLYTNNLFGKM